MAVQNAPRSRAKVASAETLLLTGVEAARLLGIAEGTLIRLRRNHALPYILVGKTPRYYRADLEAWLQARTVREPSPK